MVITSPFYGLLQSSGDATILIASDFQDPIELIPQLIKKWEENKVFCFKKVLLMKILVKSMRKLYYRFCLKFLIQI